MNFLFYFLLILDLVTGIIIPFFYILFLMPIVLFGSIPTSFKAIKKIREIIADKGKDKENFYDLGCGMGFVVLAIKKKFPELSVFGIEKRTFPLFLARLASFLLRRNINPVRDSEDKQILRSKQISKGINFVKADFFKIDLRNADIVYAYLWPEFMLKLEKKLKKELKNGSLVITNTFHFPNWQPKETYIVHPKEPNFEKLFFYVKEEI